MRIRIVTRPSGRIDGVPLDRFDPGVVYDVNASIGTYLMATGYAQAVADMNPAIVVPLDTPVPTQRPVKAAASTRDSAHERARKKQR
jgi:hypothetical protein